MAGKSVNSSIPMRGILKTYRMMTWANTSRVTPNIRTKRTNPWILKRMRHSASAELFTDMFSLLLNSRYVASPGKSPGKPPGDSPEILAS
jgi:hypothetical protein